MDESRYYLATQLLSLGMQVKIIEKDSKKCETLCEILLKDTIINGDAPHYYLLIEEGIHENILYSIALTGMDEENIIMACLLPQSLASAIRLS